MKINLFLSSITDSNQLLLCKPDKIQYKGFDFCEKKDIVRKCFIS